MILSVHILQDTVDYLGITLGVSQVRQSFQNEIRTLTRWVLQDLEESLPTGSFVGDNLWEEMGDLGCLGDRPKSKFGQFASHISILHSPTFKQRPRWPVGEGRGERGEQL